MKRVTIFSNFVKVIGIKGKVIMLTFFQGWIILITFSKKPFRCGAMVAQTAVNRKVVGSNPTTGANLHSEEGEIRPSDFSFFVWRNSQPSQLGTFRSHSWAIPSASSSFPVASLITRSFSSSSSQWIIRI